MLKKTNKTTSIPKQMVLEIMDATYPLQNAPYKNQLVQNQRS